MTFEEEVHDYSLDKWRAVMRGEVPQPSPGYLVVCFPNDDVRTAFLANISGWPEMEMRSILRNMLGDSCGYSILDAIHVASLKMTGPRRALDPSNPEERHFSEYDKRSILAAAKKGREPVWPGISWVLDLLPESPREALNAASAYFAAHCQVLPDLRLSGLSDAMMLIRNRYITQGETERERKVSILRSLDPRDLEFLFAALYRQRGYRVTVTPRQKDGGKDIVAELGREKVCIECKNWGARVGVEVVRAFGYVIVKSSATSGVLVSVNGFTEKGPETAEKEASEPFIRHRITLLDGHAAVQELNEYLGTGWHVRVDNVIAREKSKELK